MRSIFIILLGLLMAGTVQAQLNLLSDNRSVSVSGWVEDSGGNITGSYAQTNLPSAPFAGFNSQAGGSTDAGYSQATQNSAITPYSISSASFAAVSVATGLYGSGFAANAEANSIFEVGFNIQQPLDYHFSAFQDIEAVGGFISFEMSSANHGDIFNSSTESTFGNNNLDYSGILPPDDYTFRVQEYLSYNSFGSSYAGGNMNCNLVLSVPEPATIGPFLALIWLGMVALKRKLAKA